MSTSVIDHLFPDGLPENWRAWGIVMPEAARNTLVGLQDQMGWHLHRVSPVPLTDGRWALSADVLSEAHPSGLFSGVELITAEMLSGVAAVPWADVVALLPVYEESVP